MFELFSSDITLLAHDVDINNRWKISSMLSYAQDVANEQCNRLGCGWNDLMEKYKTCYVLTRMRVEMKSYPQSYSKVRISTWPENNKKVIFTRHFTFDLQDGTNLGNAVSQWVLMNTETRNIVKPSDCNIIMPNTDDLVPPLTMPKKFFVDDNHDCAIHRNPVYSDFDYNGHVNNARYLEWVCDLFNPERYKDNMLEVIDIKYNKEIRCGDKVILNLTDKKEESVFFVKGTDPSGTSLFEVYGKWQH